MLVRAKLPAEVGAVVRKAIEAAVALAEKDPAGPDVSAEASEREPFTVNDAYGAKRADALRRLADSFLTRQTDSAGSVADRYQVVVHIDQRLLATGDLAKADANHNGTARLQRCELEDETDTERALALETARRLGCDCSLVGIVEDEDGEPLSVGRKTRSISPALQRALKSRDGGCRFPGCDRTHFTEGHHVKHWADGGETKLANLVTLCTFHHRLVHEGGFGLRTTDDGVLVFTRPDGRRVEANGSVPVRFRGSASPQAHVDELFERNLSRGLRIDATTARCQWLGDRMDYGWAVGNLIQLRDERGSATRS